MTTERDIAPLIRSWLRDEPDGAVDHVLDAALARVDATPQRRTVRRAAGRIDMNLIVRVGAAAAVLAMAAALGYSLIQNVGTSVPAPSSDASAGPSSTASSEPTPSPAAGVPPELAHVFIAEPREIDGLVVTDRRVMDLREFVVWTATDLGNLQSLPSITESGELRLEARGTARGCQRGAVGTYPYHISPGGTVLTIGEGTDECAARASAMPGEWRRSSCLDPENWCLGLLEAGSQRSLFFDPFRASFESNDARYGALSYAVPDGWANAGDWPADYLLVRADDYTDGFSYHCLDCPDSIWFGAAPAAAMLDCSDQPDPEVGTSAEDLAAWLRAHPGLDVVNDYANQGRPASGTAAKITLDVVALESYADACQDPELEGTHVPIFSNGAYDFGIRVGDRHRLILVEADDGTSMVVAIDSLDPDDLDALIGLAQPIVDSIRLTAP